VPAHQGQPKLAMFHQQGFSQATVIGEVTQGSVGLTLR
jgi:hypothetical protein